MKSSTEFTPHQVGELLSVKPAYVHELCRTGRIPATKSGKYWMIPVAGLKRWLYQNRDVDGSARASPESLNHGGDPQPSSKAGAAGGPRGNPSLSPTPSRRSRAGASGCYTRARCSAGVGRDAG